MRTAAIAQISRPEKGRTDRPAVMPRRLKIKEPHNGHARPKDPMMAPSRDFLAGRADRLARQENIQTPKLSPKEMMRTAARTITAVW